jgi:hypothetical protein
MDQPLNNGYLILCERRIEPLPLFKVELGNLLTIIELRFHPQSNMHWRMIAK